MATIHNIIRERVMQYRDDDDDVDALTKALMWKIERWSKHSYFGVIDINEAIYIDCMTSRMLAQIPDDLPDSLEDLLEEIHTMTPVEALVVVDDVYVPNWSEPCGNCHREEVFYWSVQTRSGDEPATDFFRCLHCGSRWTSS